MAGKKYKTGFVLGGGGARGFAHLGLIEALAERGVVPDIFAGVSAGAIVAVYLAAGYSPKEAFKLLKNKGLLSYTKVQWPTDGLLSLEGLRSGLVNNIMFENLEDLPTPVHVGVSNMNSGKIEYYSNGKLCDWVIASSSIPVLFSPQKINGKIYADGGLLNNLPSEAIAELCENVIGINISPIHQEDVLDSLLKIATRTFQISVDVTANQGKALCDLYIEPQGISEIELLDTKSADKTYDIGYQAGIEIPEESLKRFL